MNTGDDMAKLSQWLGVQAEQQDWGIDNADAARLDEFARFYETQSNTDVQRAAMAGLILASANEALLTDESADLDEVDRMLPRIASDAEWEHDYWRGLDGDEFPLGEWLRRRER